MAKSLTIPVGKRWVNFLVQMIFTCLRYTQRRGGRESAPCGRETCREQEGGGFLRVRREEMA
jgi:hypothetical protein